MDVYSRKKYWKWYLAAIGIGIVIISLAYTRYVAGKLAEREQQQADQFAEAVRYIMRLETDTLQLYYCDLTLQGKIIEQNTTIPAVIVNAASGRIESYRNIEKGNPEELDTTVVRQALNRMIAEGADTIDISIPPERGVSLLIFSHSRLLNQLRWYPYIQLMLIATFIWFGYMGFSAARRAEENLVWLGMAKETAHQLGTPISAILGWIEALKALNEDNPVNTEMLDELQKDVVRLELVADRFSKIGAQPDLHEVNLYEELEKCRLYMQRRAPRRVTFDFPKPYAQDPLHVRINQHLFDWVIENLLRNAIDAMEDGAGRITCQVSADRQYAQIEISDTGKGIPSSKFSAVFKPGYSTKTRGWGLGLSLSKRIVEQYHGGKIFVKKSELGKGTTFCVKLPIKARGSKA